MRYMWLQKQYKELGRQLHKHYQVRNAAGAEGLSPEIMDNFDRAIKQVLNEKAQVVIAIERFERKYILGDRKWLEDLKA